MNEKELGEKELSEKELRGLTIRHQQYQYQAEAIAQQMSMVRLSIGECDQALRTITELEGAAAGKETLVSIGSGSYIHASLTKPDKVIIGVGAGVSIEKNLGEAKVNLTKRREELSKFFERLNTSLAQLTQELQNIQAIIARHAPKAKQQQ